MVIGKVIPENGLASPSQIGRFIAILGLLIICFYKNLNVTWVYAFICLSIIEIHAAFLHSSEIGFVFGLINISKLVYLSMLYLVIKDFFDKDHQSAVFFIGRIIKWNLLIISFSLIISTVTGIGNSTYGYGFGTKGFFASGNGLGVYFGVMTLISIYLKSVNLYADITNKTLFFISLSVALIGSKAALIFSIICILHVIWFSSYRIFGVVVILMFFIFGSYYLLEIFNLIFDVVSKRYANSSGIIEFLGSGRYDYVINAFDELLSQPDAALRILFGGGAFLSFQSPSLFTGYDTIEADLFDVLFMYGIFCAIFLLCMYIYILIKLNKNWVLFLAAILCVFHSLLAGHVIFNGMSSLCVVILLVFATCRGKINREKVYT
ncbi:TPA: hypothetical protein ACSP0C_000698 [Aeromonas veronii]